MALGDAAAKLGLPVFPCGENKRPVTTNGFKNAATDKAAILSMFSLPGAALIGMPTGHISGLVAVDIDIKPGADGKVWLDENSDALPPTRTHRTRSGGLHLLFRAPEGVEIRNSASRLAPGVDVRGEGGYIIVPPSPGYQLADPVEPADMPRWLIRACMREERPAEPAPRMPPRHDGGSSYGLKALSQECEAIRTASFGQQELTLNSAGLKIGALVAGGEIDESIALSDLLQAGRGIASQSGREPWTDREVETKLRRAFDDGKRTPRSAPEQRPNASAEPPPHLVFDQAYYDSLERDYGDVRADSEPVDPTPHTAPSSGLPLVYFEDIKPNLIALDFVEDLLGEQSSIVIYGESNSGKTFFTTDLALHVAAGMTWRGREVEQGGVVYAALEGSRGFSNRISAWREHHDSGSIPFAAIPASLNLLDPDADTARLIAAIQEAAAKFELPVKLVIIDTLSRALAGGNENASEDMGALVINMDRIRQATGAAVAFVHHCGKDQAKGARGHSLLRAAVETEIEVAKADEGASRFATVVKQREMETKGTFEFRLIVSEIGANQRGKPITTCLVEHVESEQSQRPNKLAGHARTSFELLMSGLAEHGEVHHSSFGQPSIPEQWWRDRFYDRAMPAETQDAKQKAFKRAANTLIQMGRVGLNRGRVWIVR